MLKWIEVDGVHLGYSGTVPVARVETLISAEVGDAFAWEMLFIDESGEIEADVGTLRDAMIEAEATFTRWLRSLRCVHLPDGHQIVPVEPDEVQLKVGQDAYDRKANDMYSPTPTEEYEAGGGPMGYAYRAMLAAATKRGDCPYAPGTPKNNTMEGVDGDSVATTGQDEAQP